jgi:hypothetical protein
MPHFNARVCLVAQANPTFPIPTENFTISVVACFLTQALPNSPGKGPSALLDREARIELRKSAGMTRSKSLPHMWAHPLPQGSSNHPTLISPLSQLSLTLLYQFLRLCRPLPPPPTLASASSADIGLRTSNLHLKRKRKVTTSW